MTSPVTVQLYLGGSWTDVTTYVLQDPGIVMRVGQQAEGATADASECRLSFKNKDGRFSPRNTAGAYYGNLLRGTYIWIKVGATTRYVGEIAEFPASWDEHGAKPVVTLVANGLLRRLAHAASLESTLTTAIRIISAGTHIKGYWPIEDSAGSTSVASALVGGTPGTITGSPVFDAVDLSAGTHNVATWGGASATFTPATGSATKFTAGCYIKLPATGALTGGEELFRCDVDGTARSWRVLYSPTAGGAVFFQVLSNQGVELLATANVTVLDGSTFYCKMECKNNGANVDYAVGTLDAGTTITGSIATASVGAPLSAGIGLGTIAIPAAADVAIGHVVLGDTNTVLAVSDFDDGRSGYNGESVDDRMARLATQNDITIDVTSGATAPVEMGPQPDGTLLDVLRAAEKADVGGILADYTLSGAPGLTYITRKARYNDQRPLLTLNYSSEHLNAPLLPTDDDQNLRNDVKANREGGSSARATKATGALSTADYPTGVGPYPFEDTYGTYDDAALPYLAQWVLTLGTVDETRWPAITIDLIRNSSLKTDVEALTPGSRVRITNLPAYSGASSVDLQVVGWEERVTAKTRQITLVCTPGSPWFVFELDDTTFGKLDTGRLAF